MRSPTTSTRPSVGRCERQTATDLPASRLTLLPSTVILVTARGTTVTDPLLPEESAVVRGAVEKRQREFALGRHCARDALRQLGAPAAPLLPGPHREPLWPSGVTGSITHCDGFGAAAVARTDRVRTIGIDAEPNLPLPDGIVDRVTLPEERSWLAVDGPRVPGTAWDRLIFSAKESVYKAWFPLAHRWLGFDQARVHIDPVRGSFCAELLVPAPIERSFFEGRYELRDGLILTAVVVPTTQ